MPLGAVHGATVGLLTHGCSRPPLQSALCVVAGIERPALGDDENQDTKLVNEIQTLSEIFQFHNEATICYSCQLLTPAPNPRCNLPHH
jgi:hypothetical protein